MVINVSGNYTLEVNDSWRLGQLQEVYLLCDTTSSSVQIDLFEIADLERFWNVKIFITDLYGNSAVNNIVINAFGSDTIDSVGTSSITLSTNGAAVELQVVSNTQWMASESVGGGVGPTPVIQLGAGIGSSVRIGNGNTASGSYSTALAFNNSASGYASSVLGGQNNTAFGDNSTVSNGTSNTASGTRSTVVNGGTNTASGFQSTVSNGTSNTASGNRSTVSNGTFNTASGIQSTVLNGTSNVASGCRSFIASGQFNNTCSLADTFIVGSCILADRVCATFVNNLSITNIPTSSVGLPSGSVWRNGTILEIVP